jgi:hypothetical protein
MHGRELMQIQICCAPGSKQEILDREKGIKKCNDHSLIASRLRTCCRSVEREQRRERWDRERGRRKKEELCAYSSRPLSRPPRSPCKISSIDRPPAMCVPTSPPWMPPLLLRFLPSRASASPAYASNQPTPPLSSSLPSPLSLPGAHVDLLARCDAGKNRPSRFREEWHQLRILRRRIQWIDWLPPFFSLVGNEEVGRWQFCSMSSAAGVKPEKEKDVPTDELQYYYSIYIYIESRYLTPCVQNSYSAPHP